MAITRMGGLKKVRAANVRAQCQLTQRQLAERAKVSRTVVYYAEKGIAISRISAYAMLNVLNPIRNDAGLPSLDIDDLDWKIQGDGEESEIKT